ncbi:Chlorophyll a-b binding protein 8, chloroplastic [Auxenochlorella protothecoides]|uniref:Chlorophyll a-b binding protein, chloroplastic n=1 Tax=Auxenochlorella protothecoides TaxID=3075 RepID=A0A087SNB8_AUXPR|nr:Chlorophyll a-b binding protein 8, chloroplastic [Auxenochlorella protothecoides]KFM27222.1 Chlorophyll a-b binding protein 8, chloroplastic [Auxenochlorella protothecoides]RMZ57059.1 hypothetical protein APUTEX25_002291 [Auxenochlorella protothecoides]|eukprot:RMZ57059.1 hypothetical protein APUTEX25_002291 [Auxenochlorella protothecoides]
MQTAFGQVAPSRVCGLSGAARRASVIARAENNKIQKVDRIQKNGPLYLNFASDQSLTYLDGTLPADFGFDPLGLSDPEGAGGFVTPEWLAYGEVYNGRWAMLGAAGVLIPDVLSHAGLIPQTPEEIKWWKTGVIPPAGQYDKLWLDPYSLFWIEAILMNFVELRRYQDYRNPGSMGRQYFLGLEGGFKGSGEPAYPGGPFFNPLGFGTKSADDLKVWKTKELRNGRLAMIAMLGFAGQAVATDRGPVEGLLAHLSDPFGNNVIGNLSHFLR